MEESPCQDLILDSENQNQNRIDGLFLGSLGFQNCGLVQSLDWLTLFGKFMNIEKVEAFILSQQLSESFYFSQSRYDTRSVCLVKLTLDDGLTGWGEGYGPAGLVMEGVKFFAPLVLHKDPLEQEELWHSMYFRSFDHARSGILLSALSAIDVALWDLKGKILKQPISVLLGGRRREAVKAYATGMYFSDCGDLPSKLAEEAQAYKQQGFGAVKMKVGLGVEQDIKNVRAVRKAIGPDISLMVDANHAFSFREALRLSEEMEDLDIRWFEEPLTPEDYEGYRELRERSGIPIAAGECEYLRYGFLRLFKNRCVDIAQPDPCAAGGFTETKKIGDLANTFGVDFAPHCWGSCIAVAVSLHLLSNWRPYPGRLFQREPLLELDRTENLFREELGFPKAALKDGRVEVSGGAGLGIEINSDLVQKYLVESFES